MKKIILTTCSLLLVFQASAQLNTDRIMTIGRNALYFEDYVLSIQYFTQVIKSKPYLAEPFLYRGMAKIQLSDYQGADKDCSEAIERNPFLPFAYYVRGFARNRLEFYSEAISDFTKALEFSPDKDEIILNRMLSKELNNDFKGAYADLLKYERLKPKSTSILYDKGRLLLSLGDTLGGQECFEKYLKSDSISSSGWSALALLKMQQKDYNGALNYYNQAIKRKSTFFGDYLNRGMLNVLKKNYNQALEDYNLAASFNSKNESIYFNRSLLRFNLGDYNNALDDIKTALNLDTTNFEALLQKAEIEYKLRNYREAIVDYKKILVKYKYFIPAYISLANAYEKYGNEKEAFRNRQIAYEIDKNKDQIKERIKFSGQNGSNKNIQKNLTIVNKLNLFNRFSSENKDVSNYQPKYESSIRGSIQHKYTDVINEKDFILTYYAKPNELKRTNTSHSLLEKFNKENRLGDGLKITTNEVSVTAEIVNGHFELINTLTKKSKKDANDYFNLALEFSLVQDYMSAIECLNNCIRQNADFVLAYFLRAEIQKKLLDFKQTQVANDKLNQSSTDTNKSGFLELDLIIQDYIKTIQMQPNFSFAHYNLANILCTQKNFQQAIEEYGKAIEIDTDFAEAYFNRGLTKIFIGKDAEGLSDLSKAGELGIYRAYNLIQRFK